jgi:hypothetical protein
VRCGPFPLRGGFGPALLGCITEAREARRYPSGYDALLVIREFGLLQQSAT